MPQAPAASAACAAPTHGEQGQQDGSRSGDILKIIAEEDGFCAYAAAPALLICMTSSARLIYGRSRPPALLPCNMKQSRTWHVKMLGMILPWIAVQLVAAARPPEKSQLVSPCEWCPPGPCPRLSDIQDAKIAKSFNISRFEGLWYEVAYKDITQPRICKCTTSNKQRINDCQLLDRFSIQCAGKKYDEDLLFNLTEHNGFFLGHWTNLPGVDKITFPDLVVDVGEGDDEDESYRWAIEFQCVNGPRDNIVFFGINFYARNVTDGGLLNEMEMSARAHNLSGFMDFKRSMHTVDHPGCTYTAFA